MTAMPLQPFTAAETARLAAIEAAPDAPESHATTIERMARAICDSVWDDAPGINWPWNESGERARDFHRRLAAAAAAAYRAEHESEATTAP